MTDRELLELAAKAAGYVVEYDKVDGRWHRQEREGQPSDCWPRWNPLHDDSDAFRLMVELAMDVDQSHPGFVTIRFHRFSFAMEEPVLGMDNYLPATRRAITRAAAEIQLARERQCSAPN